MKNIIVIVSLKLLMSHPKCKLYFFILGGLLRNPDSKRPEIVFNRNRDVMLVLNEGGVHGNSVAMVRWTGEDSSSCVRAYYHLNGYVNQQNCGEWSSENPKVKHETQLHSLKVTVWCAIHVQGIIGPHFFEDGRGRAVTVVSDRYVSMFNNFFEPVYQDFDGYNRDSWFQ